MAPTPNARRVSSSSDLGRCFALRLVVFGQGQGVAEYEDFDGLDPVCEHFLVWDSRGRPVGTARLREVEEGAYLKAERVAVLGDLRRRGFGRALMEALERRTSERGHRRLVLNAQLDVVPFYEHLGYRADGPVFHEAEIPHRRMERSLSSEPAAHQDTGQQRQG